MSFYSILRIFSAAWRNFLGQARLNGDFIRDDEQMRAPASSSGRGNGDILLFQKAWLKLFPTRKRGHSTFPKSMAQTLPSTTHRAIPIVAPARISRQLAASSVPSVSSVVPFS